MRRLVIAEPGGSGSRSVEFQFDEAEARRLRAFVQSSDELVATQYFKEEKQATLRIIGKQGQGVEIIPFSPPVAICDALLFRMRPFVLEREITHFPSIAALIGRHLSDEHIRKWLRGQSEQWSGKKVRSKMQVTDSSGVLNSDQAIMDYLNGFEYHRDSEKQDRFEWTRGFLGDQGLRVFFLLLIMEKAKSVIAVSALSKVLLGDMTSFEASGDVIRLGRNK
jgi:hypothetical protein